MKYFLEREHYWRFWFRLQNSPALRKCQMSFLRGWQEETFKNRISILKFIFSQCRNTLFYVKVNQYMLCIFCGWFTVSSYSYVIWTLGQSNFHHHILKFNISGWPKIQDIQKGWSKASIHSVSKNYILMEGLGSNHLLH